MISFVGGGLIGVGFYVLIVFFFLNIGIYFIGFILILVGVFLVSFWFVYDIVEFCSKGFVKWWEGYECWKEECFVK